eukprot:TRINITY_DN3784_c0_g3_i1.p1 TRINITY_DN3784_c0_g3~~TRINITY_DN3784_c0_g3_i1.p1  ORF type:complete len:377 (+),score=208.59 TRINITY_DN3784_c0_g3_i1:1243-2373(+)
MKQTKQIGMNLVQLTNQNQAINKKIQNLEKELQSIIIEENDPMKKEKEERKKKIQDQLAAAYAERQTLTQNIQVLRDDIDKLDFDFDDEEEGEGKTEKEGEKAEGKKAESQEAKVMEQTKKIGTSLVQLTNQNQAINKKIKDLEKEMLQSIIIEENDPMKKEKEERKRKIQDQLAAAYAERQTLTQNIQVLRDDIDKLDFDFDDEEEGGEKQEEKAAEKEKDKEKKEEKATEEKSQEKEAKVMKQTKQIGMNLVQLTNQNQAINKKIKDLEKELQSIIIEENDPMKKDKEERKRKIQDQLAAAYAERQTLTQNIQVLRDEIDKLDFDFDDEEEEKGEEKEKEEERSKRQTKRKRKRNKRKRKKTTRDRKAKKKKRM